MAYYSKLLRMGSAAALLFTLAACNGFKTPNQKNFTRALNYYYSNHDDCLFPDAIRFPYEASTAGAKPDRNKVGLDALAAAGLLKSLEDRDIHVKRYEVTTYGSHVPPRFCYGHRVVTSVDGFTPPATANGQQATQVSYHYKMMDIPGWADSDQIRKAFPVFAKESTAGAEDKTTLVMTVNGWQVPE